MALLLTETDVTSLLTMSLALEAVEEAFRWQGESKLTNRPRVRLPVPGGLLHVMPAALPEARVMGLKAYATVRGRAKFVVLLFSAESATLLAVIEADRLGQMRTGAASGVATRYLARPDADRVGCYGTGWQARSQLEAVCAVRRVREVRVYGRDAARRARFAEEMSGVLGVPVARLSSRRPRPATRRS
jgi:ornithine cyclodeaminase/alanine dehydrogenase